MKAGRGQFGVGKKREVETTLRVVVLRTSPGEEVGQGRVGSEG